MARQEILDQVEKYVKPFRITKGKNFRLKDFDPADTCGLKMDKGEAAKMLQRGNEWLAEEQEMLYAQDRWSVLLIFQAMDAAGKDGTIKHVMSGVNPQGCQVFSFKQPSSEDLDHDFMWRYAKSLPERGRIGIFNRSYYEEVLVVRVHPEILERQKLPKDSRGPGLWKRRFQEINDWERTLTDNGIKIVKLFLNLSKEEQRTRFLRRIDLPDHNWKFSSADVREREYWDDYQRAFSAMLSHTSTDWAPWHVIPADRKWYARIAAAAVIANALIEIDPRYPTVGREARRALQEVKKTLEAQSPKGAAPDPFEAEQAEKADDDSG